jgi:hypothetical protein
MAYIRRIKPNLKSIELEFNECSQFTPPDVGTLFDGLVMSVTIADCHSFINILTFLKSAPQLNIMQLLIYFHPETYVKADEMHLLDTNAKNVTLYISKKQFTILKHPECFTNVKWILINMNGSKPSEYGGVLCLDHLTHCPRVSIYAHDFDLELSTIVPVTELYVRSAIGGSRLVESIQFATRLEKIILFNYNFQCAHYEHLYLYELIKQIPKNDAFQLKIYADMSPLIVSFIKRLINECGVNPTQVEAVYWDDPSYITCRLIENKGTNIKCSKFAINLWKSLNDYVPPEYLVNASTQTLLGHMAPTQQFLWALY